MLIFIKILAMYLLYAAIGLIIGLLGGWLFANKHYLTRFAGEREHTLGLDKEKSILAEKLNLLGAEKEKLESQLAAERKITGGLNIELARVESEYKGLQEKLDTQKAELEQIQKKFTTEFENIAHKILRENSAEFTQTNQRNIGEILNPLKEKIEKFEKKVEDTYEKGLKDQTNLQAEIRNLHELNTRISQEANNLTKALKADTKKMGNWGELILERILEQTGLVKGQEYYTQYTDRTEDGSLIRPDVVVVLPEKKHIVIDSKVSLLAYDAYVNADDEPDRERWIKAHVDSIREHVKGLSDKNYQGAQNLDSPDFVLLFMPLESAFSLAIQKDPELFNLAWQRKIVIVSPTTLLATLKTIESIWKHEKQTQNALEIARQGASLYDKFYSFITDLEKIGNQIDSLRGTYDEAHKKLATGRGNLIRQAEKLKLLGVKTEKSLSEKYITDDTEEQDDRF